MDRGEIQRALREAVELADEVPEPYRAAAFRFAAWANLRSSSPDGQRAVGETGPAVAQVPAGLPGTINELLAILHDTSHQDKFEAVVYFSLKNDRADGLPTDQIAAAYSSARMPRPSNPADVIAKCVRRGHLMEGPRRDGQKTWRLTVTGERYIEDLIRERIAD